MLKNRAAGVLMHISTIPSEYGIGVFDENCRYFADKLHEMNFGYWQVLPFNPVDKANSPYCSESAFAGNLLFIDPKALYDKGLCTKEQYESNIYHGSPYTADYEFAYKNRLRLLKAAFSNISSDTAESVRAFTEENPWLSDYALFMALKEKHADAPWWEWEEKYARFEKAKELRRDFEKECAFWKFVQYTFFSQWTELKKYINSKGIAVIGDMPIYVAMDSADVWANTAQFLIDEKTLKPEKVAGCPPDYFSEDGQLWGNPLYNWAYMEKDGYKWWLSRIKQCFKTYDSVRIDHFRAFASFWEIPASSKTAKNGAWAKGPGMKLFDKVKETFGELPIIAEDLGIFGEDVTKLLSDTGFPGMKVLQFAYLEEESEYLPRTYTTDNCVVYSGSHDSDCTKSWYKNLSGEQKKIFTREVHRRAGQSGTCAVIEAAMRSRADLAVIPMQDYLELENEEARMNTPSVATGNWQWRMNSNYKRRAMKEKIAEIASSTHRFALK